MARLAPFLKDLSTLDRRVAAADALMAHVYGPYTFSPTWQPRPLADNKSRYLWTDAFGVVNYISLATETGKTYYLDQADALIKAVHNVLGRERPGGAHAARLGGASDAHPTAAGLRIGKIEEEGADCDGQYFHYLTKWAFALNRMSLARGDATYNDWAAELLAAAHPHFVHRPSAGGGPPRMYWKMSIDLSRPAVPSEGNLDPFDGLVTVHLIRAAAGESSKILSAEAADFAEMVAAKYKRYSSSDPLDLGEALWLTHWEAEREPWAAEVARRSASGLDTLWNDGYFREPAGFRLAFRELGTTLGVQVNEAAGPAWRDQRAPALHEYWASRVLERDSDITPVMMAASLLPGAWDRRFEARLGTAASGEKKFHV